MASNEFVTQREKADAERKHLAIGVVISLIASPGWGGAVTAYLEGGYRNDAVRLGGIAGIVAALILAIPVSALVVLVSMGQPGDPVGLLIFLNGILLVSFPIAGALGGLMGHWVRFSLHL